MMRVARRRDLDGLTSVTLQADGKLVDDGFDEHFAPPSADDVLGGPVSNDDFVSAEFLVESFFAERPDGVELEPELVVSDIEADAYELEAELELLEKVGVDVPALPLGDVAVPVALRAIAGASWPGDPLERPLAPGQRQFDPGTAASLRLLIERGELTTEYGTMSRREARFTFFWGARQSLARRIAAVRRLARGDILQWQGFAPLTMPQRAGGPAVSTAGCTVGVSTNSSGLRVFWSGAYFIVPTYFGAPTTPASGVLLSGTYVFGVDGGSYGKDIQWDKNAVLKLPGSMPYVHLNY
jgi:hypothetical protein